MNLGQLQALTSEYLDDINNTYFTLPNITIRLNLALRELQKKLNSANYAYYVKSVYTNTVLNQAVYAFPSDFLQIIRLDYVTQGTGSTADTQKVYYITPNQVDLLPDTSGPPAYYYFQYTNLILAPVPDGIYQIDLQYSYYVADMVLTTDVPDAPQQFHEYIALQVVRDYMVRDGRPLTNIQTKLGEYDLLLKQTATQREADGAHMVVNTQSLGND